jgi:hypothetical protein
MVCRPPRSELLAAPQGRQRAKQGDYWICSNLTKFQLPPETITQLDYKDAIRKLENWIATFGNVISVLCRV